MPQGSPEGRQMLGPAGSTGMTNAPPPGLKREQMPGYCPAGGMATAGIDWCIMRAQWPRCSRVTPLNCTRLMIFFVTLRHIPQASCFHYWL